MARLRSLSACCLLLAAASFAVPNPASATALGALLNTTGPTNTLSLQLQITCSGALCAFIGLGGAGYNQTKVSTLSGTSGLYSDDVADSIQLSSDAGGTADLLSLSGTSVTFTGLSSTLTGGGTSITVSSLIANATNAGSASVTGYDLTTPPQNIAFSMNGLGALSIGASGVTNAPNFPTIALTPTLVTALGTFGNLGDPDVDLYPDFSIQNLRGAFQSLTSTVTLGQTINITLRATFTVNLIGESLTVIPEPASIGMVALGVAGFGVATRRRARSV